MGLSYSHLLWRFIICTPRKSGRLVAQLILNSQKRVPARGEIRGDGKSNLTTWKQKYSYRIVKNLKNLITPIILGGGVIGLNLSGNISFDINKAKAADINIPVKIGSSQIEKAKELIDNVAPVINAPEVNSDTNTLSAGTPEGFLAKPLITETKTAAQAKRELVTAQKRTTSGVTLIKRTTVKGGTYYEKVGNSFPYGYCTYYVASQRPIPWRGNAGTWLSGARAFGYATGDTPQVGAIIVTSESSAGHVGIVTAVHGSEITITEMNYHGFGVISSRTIPTSYGAIKGYIY